MAEKRALLVARSIDTEERKRWTAHLEHKGYEVSWTRRIRKGVKLSSFDLICVGGSMMPPAEAEALGLKQALARPRRQDPVPEPASSIVELEPLRKTA